MSNNGMFPAISAGSSPASKFFPLVKATEPAKIARLLFMVLPVAVCLFFSVDAFAQSDVGTIVGFVKDQSGAVVPNATVTITNEATGEVHTAKADEQGHYAP